MMPAPKAFLGGLDTSIWGNPHYYPVYLDPSLGDLAVRGWRFTRLPFQSRRQDHEKMLHDLAEALGGRTQREELAALLRQGKLGTTHKQERALQRSVTAIVEQHVQAFPPYSSIGKLQNVGRIGQGTAGAHGDRELVVLDSMCARKASAPTRLQQMFDVLFQDLNGVNGREVVGIATDIPPSLMTLDRPALGLVANSTAFYARGTAALMQKSRKIDPPMNSRRIELSGTRSGAIGSNQSRKASRRLAST
jgi:hypothetical protein